MKILVAGKRRDILKKPVALLVVIALALVFVVGLGSRWALGSYEADALNETVTSLGGVTTDIYAISAVLSTLEHFGAATGEDAVAIWAEGVCSRNGVTQYSVMNSELKEKYLSVAGGKSANLIFPASDTTIDGWFISDIEELENGSSKVRLRFSLSSPAKSAADDAPVSPAVSPEPGGEQPDNKPVETSAAIAELTLTEEDGYTVISSVAVEKGLYEFTGIG